MTNDEKALWVARSSHEECIDFILSDLDYAIENLGKTKVAGRANNTYVAAAFKSRVALYAGSVARYGQTFNYSGSESGKMLTGIPEGRANDYFMQAYKASKIVEEGGYKLYEGNSDKEANSVRYLPMLIRVMNLFLFGSIVKMTLFIVLMLYIVRLV